MEYDNYELMSAVQKAVRRGQEKQAMFFALKLAAVWPDALVSRLKVMAHEDIGLGDPIAMLVALRSLDDLATWLKAKNDAWRLALANAVLSLARAKKSRLADNFQAAVRAMSEVAIPDEALDKHTRRGKAKGRGITYFLDNEPAALHPKAEQDDVYRTYESEASKFWLDSRDMFQD